jgi:uncharacterized membrane protein YvlD (DUF360 family)
MIGLTAWVLPGMTVDGLWDAILASLVIWVISWATEMLLGVKTRQSEQGT